MPQQKPIVVPTDGWIREDTGARLRAEADLQGFELQELAEKFPDLKSAAAGLDLKIRVQLELRGDDKPADDVIAQLNALLAQVSDSLQLE